MKIATFNINNINKRVDNLAAWLTKTQPDVVCLQELKAEQGAFPAATLRKLGFEAVWCGQRSWNGVAILARGVAPVLTRATLPGNPEDRDARYIEAAINGIIVSCDRRRGLLLPDLEGVDAVEDQVAIARRKGGIAPDEPVTLERFRVDRHG